MTRWFKLTIPDDVMRRMKRDEYYRVRSYLRKLERQIAARIDHEQIARAHHDLMVYGYAEYKVIR